MAKLTKRDAIDAAPRPTAAEIAKGLEPYGFKVGEQIKYSSLPGKSKSTKGTVVSANDDGNIVVTDGKSGVSRFLPPDRIKKL